MSYTNLLVHIVIRTKSSHPTIDMNHERELYAYIYTFIKAKNCKLFRLNGMPDHIHILMGLHPSVSISDFMRDLKTATSKYMKANKNRFPMFEGWGKEYYASSVSPKDKESVRQYIINQKTHHAKVNLHDELFSLCKENAIEVENKYL